ncbi:MAG: GIY-YIG nuclease family protein [Bacteroidetes bacterium]|nr:GIY-YIG nuclease family protein [Bacteroidota bacterium]MCH8942680.1 GIY-YIG nuclease family protein [Bacteroidota bacterium]
MYFTYVLYSKKYKKIYIGQTINVEKRVTKHNSGKHRYTKRYIPWSVIYTEKFNTREEAMKREKQLKSQKGREFIWGMIRK